MRNFVEYIKDSGLTAESISKKTSILHDRIVSIISGQEQPTLSELRKIAKALKVTTDFLISDNKKYEDINVLFRKAVHGTNENQNADRISYVIGNTFSLLGNYQIYSSLFENFRPLENTFKNARVLAARFREIYYKGDYFRPILDLPRIITEELNCILFVFELGNKTDGASAIINHVPFIFISPRFESRMLFTLAHELAHIITHHNPNVNFAKIDSEIQAFTRNKNNDEGFANAFASELLMPEEGVGLALQNIRRINNISGPLGDAEILLLSRIYGVSFDVAAKRCEDLNLLPSGAAISISEQLRKEYGSPEKRAENLNLPLRQKIFFPKVSPTLLDFAISKIKAGEISLGKASEILTVPIADLMEQNSED